MADTIYLNALKSILEVGERRDTRNGSTISCFGVSMSFDITSRFPLLTTKHMAWNSIVTELLWFISGTTNSKILEEQGNNIWKGNSSREYLDSIGLDLYPEGECGPIYGHQWRNFNSNGIDQLAMVIDMIKNNPTSRRIFMSAWNPSQQHLMCLPPCHVSYQFYVSNDDYLDCIMYQRSGDMFLGVPFNIASTALLVYIIAKLTKKKPRYMTIHIGDAHIYREHYLPVFDQLNRRPLEAPTVEIDIPEDFTIDDIRKEHIKLNDYVHHERLKAPMKA